MNAWKAQLPLTKSAALMMNYRDRLSKELLLAESSVDRWYLEVEIRKLNERIAKRAILPSKALEVMLDIRRLPTEQALKKHKISRRAVKMIIKHYGKNKTDKRIKRG